ncbi:MAG: valine--tRNA ligase [Candidatus Omnitrophota bacterium]|jgi:valyl-tRNA synthetase
MDIPTRFNSSQIEDKWYRFWEEKGYFQAAVNPDKKPFCIVIPPPNVTGILHMGHALNNTIQDILIRYYRMKGKESLWMPGTDHAGIATQNVVEKAIAKEGLKRQDLGREKFLERVWKWREEYGSTIIHQLKKMGASCDWSRTRFTMDEEYSKAITEVFVRLYKKGLIYRGNYIVNWCPRCQTALSDEEAPHRELQGNLYYLRYPFKHNPGQFVVVATTRPETMLGDTAVAVHPKDKRYKKLIGKILILPLINRQIKIIADNMVDRKFGTGAVKVTPAHDPNDYTLGKKHNLEFVNIMRADGRLNENAGNYKDMDRFKAREIILRDLKENQLLENIQPHTLSAGHCYRCHTIIEPYLSPQWFVKMKPLAKPAIAVVKKGKIKFYPKRFTKVYLNWMENIQDWCISRQIWWGHRIPIWYCLDCGKQILASANQKKVCLACRSENLKQDDDVLDTWFSSWLWPFATFYWPPEAQSAERRAQSKQDLDYFYPTSVLVTAPEILFFWVARMIMAGLEFVNQIPFNDVYIHGTVRDIKGKKMSKSLGNAIDPLEIISQYGTDALRFCLTSSTSQGDLFLSQEKFETGRNFANKLWNASRLIIMNLDREKTNFDLCVFLKNQEVRLFDRWILSRFYSMLKEVNRYLDNYRFNEAANLIYAFLWHEFCDWYLEIVKNNFQEPSTQLIMYKVLEKTLRVLHPIMPFITEEIWHSLNPAAESIMIQNWPHVQEAAIDKKLESQIELIFDIIRSIRTLRSQLHLRTQQKTVVSLYPHGRNNQELVKPNADLIINLANLETLHILAASKRPRDTISDITKSADIYLHFRGLIDANRERTKIKESIDKQKEILKTKKTRLQNRDFLKRAPREVVDREREDMAEIENAIKRLQQMHNELQQRPKD